MKAFSQSQSPFQLSLTGETNGTSTGAVKGSLLSQKSKFSPSASERKGHVQALGGLSRRSLRGDTGCSQLSACGMPLPGCHQRGLLLFT